VNLDLVVTLKPETRTRVNLEASLAKPIISLNVGSGIWRYVDTDKSMKKIYRIYQAKKTQT